MANHPSRLELRARSEAFLALETPADFCQLVEENPLELNKWALNPRYEHFTVSKRNGDLRMIEDPEPRLKNLQRKINTLLQGVYHFVRSDAAYGFQTACDNDMPQQHRSIMNNARQHMGQPWMLNMDILDFFHFIKTEKVAWVFLSKPFSFDKDLADLLTRLCTYNGRLPMGSPASPILSNLAAKLLDEDLQALAHSRQWIFSRYADDMTFSSRSEITHEDIEIIRDFYRAHGFEPNENKTRLMSPKDEHVVTGIVILDNRLDLTQAFYEELTTELRYLKDVAAVKGRLGVSVSDWVEDYAERIRGMIVFAEQVLGPNHFKVEQATQALAKALERPKDFGVMSWNEWPYR